MNKLFFIGLLLIQQWANAQWIHPEIERISKSANQVIDHLIQFEKFGIKEPGTPAIDQTRDWLFAYYQSLGYPTLLDSFNYTSYNLYNVVATKEGLKKDYIIVCGHYDTRNGPGANDNGSGVSVIMEMARILADVETEYSIKFIHFSGEENGLIGSTHYATQTVGANDSNLILVFNLDQLGGTKGSSENLRIKCEFDQDNFPDNNNIESKRFTDSLANWIKSYTQLEPQLDRAYSSDYVPFEDLGYTITGLYQYSQYPPYHTSGDVIEAMDTSALKEIAVGAVAAILMFSKATVLLSTPPMSIGKTLRFYPNPWKNEIHIENLAQVPYPIQITISDELGKVIQSEIKYSPVNAISMPETGKGFSVIIKDASGQIYRSPWLIKQDD